MTTIHEITDLPHWNASDHESAGEHVRQIMLFRSLADHYTKLEQWADAERCEMTALDYQQALTNRMLMLELVFMGEGPYYAELRWLDSGRWFAAVGPDEIDKEWGLNKHVAKALERSE